MAQGKSYQIEPSSYFVLMSVLASLAILLAAIEVSMLAERLRDALLELQTP